MSLGVVVKKPAEKLNVSVEFVDVLGGNTPTLVSVTAINVATEASTTSEVIATSPAPSLSGTKVTWQCIAGQAGGLHRMTATVSSSTGEVFQADVDLRVV